MSTPLPQDFRKQLDQIKFTYKSKNETKNGKQVVWISMGNTRLTPEFQTSAFWNHTDEQQPKPTLCRAPFGVDEKFSQGNSRKSCPLTVNCPDLESVLADLEVLCIQTAFKNAPSWFATKGNLTEEKLCEMFSPILKRSEKYNPNVNVKIQTDPDHPFATKVYEATKGRNGQFAVREATWQDIQRGSEVVAIIRLSSLWFMKKEFGLTLDVSSIIVYPLHSTKGIQGFNFGGSDIPSVVDMDEEVEGDKYPEENPPNSYDVENPLID